MLYFAYGANLNKNSMAHRCPDAKPVGRGSLIGWERVFRRVADIVESRNPASEVHGALWEITKDCERSLDRFEGFPRFYTKVVVTVFCHETKQFRKAMAYIMTEKSEPTSPSDMYYMTISKGLRDFRWPSSAQSALVHQAASASEKETRRLKRDSDMVRGRRK